LCLYSLISYFQGMFNNHVFILFYLIWKLYLHSLIWIILLISLAKTVKEKFGFCYCLTELCFVFFMSWISTNFFICINLLNLLCLWNFWKCKGNLLLKLFYLRLFNNTLVLFYYWRLLLTLLLDFNLLSL
jgi:hypothetical protein